MLLAQGGWWALRVQAVLIQLILGELLCAFLLPPPPQPSPGDAGDSFFLLRASSCFRNSCNILRCHISVSNSVILIFKVCILVRTVSLLCSLIVILCMPVLCCCLCLLPGHGIKLIKYRKFYTRDKISCKNPLLSHWKQQGRPRLPPLLSGRGGTSSIFIKVSAYTLKCILSGSYFLTTIWNIL